MASDAKYGELLEVECRIAWPQIGLSDAEIEKRAAKRTGKAKKIRDKKNSVTCLIKKSSKTQLKAIITACTEVAEVSDESDLENWPLVDEQGNSRDGDDEKYAEYEGYTGCIFFKTGSGRKIDLAMIDESGDVVEVKEDDASKVFYPGSNCVVIVQVCEWEPGNIVFYLQGILRINDEGKRLGNAIANGTKKLFQKFSKTATPVEEAEEEEEEAPKKSKKTVETLPKTKRREKPVVEYEEELDDEEVEDAVEEVKEKPKKKKSLSSILD